MPLPPLPHTQAFMYQLKLEAAAEPSATYRITVTLSDVIMYAGMLGVAKCGGPQIQFQPGRVDASVADGPFRLPAADEPLPHTVSGSWHAGVPHSVSHSHTHMRSAYFQPKISDYTPCYRNSVSAADTHLQRERAKPGPHMPANKCCLPQWGSVRIAAHTPTQLSSSSSSGWAQ